MGGHGVTLSLLAGGPLASFRAEAASLLQLLRYVPLLCGWSVWEKQKAVDIY